MGKKVLIALVAVIVLPLLYFLFRPTPPADPCSGSNPLCIHVTVAPAEPGGIPVIRDIPDTTVTKAATIFWKIDTPGYTFAAKGIDFDNPGNKPVPPAPPGEFDNCGPFPPNLTSSAVWSCRDNFQKSGGARFPYKVTVDGPGNPKPLDPFIVNGA